MPLSPGKLCARIALLGWVAVWLPACKNECPPLSVQEGEFCRWSHDAGVAGNAGRGSGAAAKAGRSAKGGSGGSEGDAPIVWTCEQADSACQCVLAQGSGKDSCATPKPDCCYAYPEGGNDHCDCVPLDTPACSALYMRPDAGVAASCPL